MNSFLFIYPLFSTLCSTKNSSQFPCIILCVYKHFIMKTKMFSFFFFKEHRTNPIPFVCAFLFNLFHRLLVTSFVTLFHLYDRSCEPNMFHIYTAVHTTPVIVTHNQQTQKNFENNFTRQSEKLF